MHSTPPLPTRTTIAVTNVATDFTVLAAGGVGTRHRLIAFKIAWLRSAAAQAADGNIRDGAGGTFLWPWALSQPNWWLDSQSFAFPGIQFSSNTAIVFSATSTVAGPTTVLVGLLTYTDQDT